MWAVIFCALVCQQSISALVLEKDGPGALPTLSAVRASNAANGIAGGFSAYDLNQAENYEELEHLIKTALNSIQSEDRGNYSDLNSSEYKVHKLIDIKEAVRQVVRGLNYEVVFTVGERDCSPKQMKPKSRKFRGHCHRGCRINEHGQYGKCFVRMNFVSWTDKLEVVEKKCVRVTKEEI